jgi:hypothetical protein
MRGGMGPSRDNDTHDQLDSGVWVRLEIMTTMTSWTLSLSLCRVQLVMGVIISCTPIKSHTVHTFRDICIFVKYLKG